MTLETKHLAGLIAPPPMASLSWNALRDRAASLVGATEGDFQELYREVGTLVQDCAKLAQLLADRDLLGPYVDMDGKLVAHDPMICQGNKQGRDRVTPCEPCMSWAFRTLEQIAEIVGVELPAREELT